MLYPLENYGHNCFLNSAVQCIFNIIPLDVNKEIDSLIINSIREHNTKKLHSYLFRKNPTLFAANTQQDCNETLLYIIDLLGTTLLTGKLRTTMICRRCNTPRHIIEDFVNLTRECFIKEEIEIKGCDNCKDMITKTVKESVIVEIPKYILVLNYNKHKVNMDDKLIICVNHYGSSERGHYNVDIKQNDKWYNIDDMNIREQLNVCRSPCMMIYIT